MSIVRMSYFGALGLSFNLVCRSKCSGIGAQDSSSKTVGTRLLKDWPKRFLCRNSFNLTNWSIWSWKMGHWRYVFYFWFLGICSERAHILSIKSSERDCCRENSRRRRRLYLSSVRLREVSLWNNGLRLSYGFSLGKRAFQGYRMYSLQPDRRVMRSQQGPGSLRSRWRS